MNNKKKYKTIIILLSFLFDIKKSQHKYLKLKKDDTK